MLPPNQIPNALGILPIIFFLEAFLPIFFCLRDPSFFCFCFQTLTPFIFIAAFYWWPLILFISISLSLVCYTFLPTSENKEWTTKTLEQTNKYYSTVAHFYFGETGSLQGCFVCFHEPISVQDFALSQARGRRGNDKASQGWENHEVCSSSYVQPITSDHFRIQVS